MGPGPFSWPGLNSTGSARATATSGTSMTLLNGTTGGGTGYPLNIIVVRIPAPTHTVDNRDITVSWTSDGNLGNDGWHPVFPAPVLIGAGAGTMYTQMYYSLFSDGGATAFLQANVSWNGTAAGVAPGQAQADFMGFTGFKGVPTLGLTGYASSASNAAIAEWSPVPSVIGQPSQSDYMVVSSAALGNTSGLWKTPDAEWGNFHFITTALTNGTPSGYLNEAWGSWDLGPCPPLDASDWSMGWTTARSYGVLGAQFYDNIISKDIPRVP